MVGPVETWPFVTVSVAELLVMVFSPLETMTLKVATLSALAVGGVM